LIPVPAYYYLHPISDLPFNKLNHQSMKKIIYLLSIILTTVLLTFSSCVKEPVVDNSGGSGGGTGGGGTGGGGTGGGGGGGTTPPTVTTPSTMFLARQDHSVSNHGAYYTEQFTISTTTTFFFRLASEYNTQAAIITPSQLSNFTSMAAFTGYGLFNNQFGTNVVTLSPGTYYVGVRNTNNGANKWSWELDYMYSFPASDRVTFYDIYFQDALAYATNAKFWRPFKIEAGARYFLDGCNVNMNCYIIPASELSKFQAGQTFQYYVDYYLAGGGAPGFFEIRLPVGDYVLVGSGTGRSSCTFRMDRWKVN
jgi:hypothetical protein